MGPRLVFVHGIGRRPQPQRVLERWIAALAQGMRFAGHSRMADDLLDGKLIDCAFAHYDDLYQTPAMSGPDQQVLAEVLAEALDQRLAEETSTGERSVLAEAREQLDPGGDPQGLGNVARHLINACTTLLDLPPLRAAGRWLSGKLMVGDLSQVSRYLSRGEPGPDGATLDQRIRARIRRSLSVDGPSIVVSHSLGTVVSLETLHEHSGPVPLWVTMGSPLGLRTAVYPRLVPQPPVTPQVVGRWINVADRDDLIAVRSDLTRDIHPNSDGVRADNVRIDSDGLWVHPAAYYLRAPGVAGPIAEAVGAATGRA